MNNAKQVIAEGYAFDSFTQDWTLRVEYVAKDRLEAVRWINFQRDWMKRLRIVTQ